MGIEPMVRVFLTLTVGTFTTHQHKSALPDILGRALAFRGEDKN